MAKDRYIRLHDQIKRAIAERPKRQALYRAMKRGRDNRAQTLATLPGGGADLRHKVREVKLRCLDCQQELVGQFAKNARKRGTTVFLAEDGAAAIGYILKLAQEKDARTVIKSKSLTSEEIEINPHLEEAGLQVVETDLGEFIVQQAHEKPFHLVFPSIHKTATEVAQMFSGLTGEDVAHDPKAIMKVVRRYFRTIFLNGDIGITGANVGIAESGAIVIETNEGNARLVSSIPDVHICIMGIEKIVETLEDALKMMLAHPVSATGQILTTYVTLMAGRSPLGLGQGRSSRESHIIILDNGRTQMREDPIFQDALNCIRCGACMNICPTYGVVGGHTFGYIYPGPIGIPWTAAVHGLEKAGDFASLCISCGLCKEICPVDIDIPMMIAEVKHRDMENNPPPLVNRVMMQVEALASVGSMMAPLSNWVLNNKPLRWLLEKTMGIERHRVLPPFKRLTLQKQFKHRKKSAVTQPLRQVAFFADIYANYNAPKLGMAAVEQLEERGCEVVMPAQKSSGYPYIGYGDLDRARKIAMYNVKQLATYAQKGYDIVALEPTAAYCLKRVYPKLLNDQESVGIVAERTHELFDYLLFLDAELARPTQGEGFPLKHRRFGFHVSCHQRPLSSGKSAMVWLKQHGAEVELIETGTCCGMGGTFGLKTGPLGYELAQAVGEPLFEAFKATKVEAIVTESSVCRIHLQEGTNIPVFHPLELLFLSSLPS